MSDRIVRATPDQAYAAIAQDPSARLIDVRTRAEWTFVGVPDLSAAGRDVAFVEWTGFPPEGVNERFIDQVEAALPAEGDATAYFICRSGARSHSAATAAAAHFAASGRRVTCVNVIEGFEGDLDETGKRGRLGGWKARGLPWRQS
ncbi:MAG: rhodanese-like domain-containing protein [Rhodobacteraceae bacterium]|nr:MAG: rhodanese-like domain-containing protein [Paracoccaceae bacterium]